MGFLAHLVSWPFRYALGLDLGRRRHRDAMLDIGELLEDLYETAYARLSIRLVKIPPPPGAPAYEEPLERIEIEGGVEAEQRVVGEWVAEHDGPETQALSLFVQDQALALARSLPEYRHVVLPEMASGFASREGFRIALWLWFRLRFPPYAQIRHYRDLNTTGRNLEELAAAINRRSFLDAHHASRAAGRGQIR